MGFTDIKQLLPINFFKAIIGANNPSDSNVFVTMADFKNITVDTDNNNNAHTGTLAETVLVTLYIPANTFVDKDIFRFDSIMSQLGVVSTKEYKVYLNTTADLVGTPIQIARFLNTSGGTLGVRFLRKFSVKGTTVLKTNIPPTVSLANDFSATQVYTEIAVDMTLNYYLVVTGKISVTTSETVSCQEISIYRDRK